MKVLLNRWNPSVWPFKWKLLSGTFTMIPARLELQMNFVYISNVEKFLFSTDGRWAVMDAPLLWPLLSSYPPCCPVPAGSCSKTATSSTRCTPLGTSTGVFMSAAVVTWCMGTAGRDSTQLLCWRNEGLCAWASFLTWISEEESFCVHSVDVSVTLCYLSCLHCLTDGERGKETMFTLRSYVTIFYVIFAKCKITFKLKKA